MFNNTSTIISKDFVLRYISEEDIFKRYLGLEPTDRGSFTNPLRNDDTKPGCGFYVDSRGTWKFKDHAAGYNWDCFNVVEYAYNLTFKEALIRIAIDFNLIDGQSSDVYRAIKTKKKRPPLEIRVKRRSWTKSDYAYWAQYYITPERLDFFKVFPVSTAWFLENNDLRIIYIYKEGDPCFCYHFGGYDYKLYFPLRPTNKFVHVNSSIIQGWEQLPKEGENLLITKSFKDVMAIDAVGRTYDLYACAPMSETVVIPLEAYKNLYNRFDNIGTLFDFDRAGVRLARKYEKEYSLTPYLFGKEFRTTIFGKALIKDFADFSRNKGLNETHKLIQRFIKQKEHDDREEAF
jgi:hypothetical protein